MKNIVLVSYLNEKEDEVLKYKTKKEALEKFEEIERSNNYKYLELAVDNVVTPTEGTYDILTTSSIETVGEIIDDRWQLMHSKIYSEVEEEITKIIKVELTESEKRKRVKNAVSSILKNDVPEILEDKLSKKVLKYKNFKIKNLFTPTEIEIIKGLDIDLNSKLSCDYKKDSSKIKLRNKKIIEIC